ncbi:MAG TPA: exodeoxyribonuclease VII large subunit [Bryobacteraceae bacterium]|nr:exodeoxyribonuclease VII large subunit [Bryobacteraceae bacterium]
MEQQIALDWTAEPHYYTVGELTTALRGVFAEYFTNIWVAGEISGTKLAPSGHYYFTLKDEAAQLKCACYKMTARYLKFKPQDGVAALVRGRVDLYEVRGEVQLIVEAIEPRGHGALQLTFEQLKKKLEAEGLFAAERKRPLPAFPERIGIVTSPSGAVIQDMLNVMERRSPGRHIRLYPAQVQGEGAAEQVARGLEYFSQSGWAEVVIVARGGGSLEDLWTFNEERVARAIAECSVPVISAVGHETDFTIADFVADLRAPTPSAAAELVVPTRESLLDRLSIADHKLAQSTRLTIALAARALHGVAIDRVRLHQAIGRQSQRIDDFEDRIRDAWRTAMAARKRALEAAAARLSSLDVRLRFAEARRRLEACDTAAFQAVRLRLSYAHGELAPLEAHLKQLSPLGILERGYAIVERNGKIVKSAEDAPVGTSVRIRLRRGNLDAQVMPARPDHAS